jgi:hypothetical protein
MSAAPPPPWWTRGRHRSPAIRPTWPHGVAGPVLYDLGDFLDDYRVDPRLRNDLGLLFLVTLDAGGPVRLEALPLKLEFCHTRLAAGDDAAWMRRRFRTACTTLGTTVENTADRLVVSWP